jgi:feruloyl esterase
MNSSTIRPITRSAAISSTGEAMRPGASAVLLALFALAGSAAHAASCGDLAKLTLPDVSVSSAGAVAAGAYAPPGTSGKPVTVSAFCRVELRATPTADSRIGIEVWMPEGSAWNGKLLGIGNGGYSSVLDYPAMAEGLRSGYAVVATDQGHQGDDLRFVVGHPGKIDDWADRAIHVMTTTAKLVVRNALGRFPDHTYFNGCSTGGFQGMVETQRYPDDYDGVVAGAPGYPRLNLSASFLAAWATNHDAKGAEILPLSKLPMLNKAAIDACGTDGVIEDPRSCRFDPAALLCKAEDGPECLTEAQVGVVRAIYAGPRNRTGELVFPGWDPGSEAPGGDPRLGWTAYIVGQPEPVRLELWKYWVLGDPAFDWRSFDLGRDLNVANALLPVMNAVNPHLDAFRAHGGKLLMYHGWADNVSSARGTIDYYESVQDAIGDQARTQNFFRVFLVPGMGHCRGGPGTDTFDPVAALAAWVEQDKAPDEILATHQTAGRVERSRPLCPYPQQARYRGTGARDDAASFMCAAGSVSGPTDRAWLRRLQERAGR